MKKVLLLSFGLLIFLVIFLSFSSYSNDGNLSLKSSLNMEKNNIILPSFSNTGSVSIEQTLYNRRSVRSYKNETLSLKDLSQILWSAQGISDRNRNFRTAPSAGATFPLELYAVVGNVENLEPGIYKYNPFEHSISLVVKGDKREDLRNAALRQASISNAAFNLVFTAIVSRTSQRYGDRALQYVFIETGHAAQNVYLQAEALNLGTVAIGAFYEDRVRAVLKVSDELPVYIMPIGRK